MVAMVTPHAHAAAAGVMVVRAGKPGSRMLDRGVFADRIGGMHGVRLSAVTRERCPARSHISAVTRQSGASRTGRRAPPAQAAARAVAAASTSTAAHMSAASMRGETAVHPAASMAPTTAVPAPTLRPHGYSQQKRERRDGDQATHIASIIAPFQRRGGFSERHRRFVLTGGAA